MNTTITLRCVICFKCEYVTQTYLDNLSKTGWNELLCSECFCCKIMHELLK